MKFLTVLFILKSINCDVINSGNKIETTTVKDSVKANVTHDNEIHKTNHEVRYVYLEDVLYALKSQNWTREEEPCLNQTVMLIQNLRNFTLWAVWDWDSIASEPLGLLYGNRYQLGHFDQCINPPWTDTHPELKTQYCLSEIVLERTDKPVRKREKTYNDISGPYGSALDYLMYQEPHARPLYELTWGVCVPAKCKPRSVERLLSIMLARSHLAAAGIRPHIAVKEECQSTYEPLEFDELFYAFVGTISVLAVSCLICTCLNSRGKNDNCKQNGVIKAFCIRENAKNLLEMKKEGFEVLYGIRFLSICYIAAGHVVGLMNAAPVSNGTEVDFLIHTAVSVFVLHNDLFVDSFFFLSGFLLGNYFKKTKRLPNVFILILKRYVRIVVGFAVLVFYMCAVFAYTGSGPLWRRISVQGETEACRKNWWLSLLMINNYIGSNDICVIASWYIPSDFHFFVVTALVFYVCKSYPRLFFIILSALSMASIIASGVIQYLYNLDGMQLFTYEFLKDIRGNQSFQMTYIKSHTRYAPYAIGLACGYFFIDYKSTRENKKISQKWSVLGTCAALTGLLFAICFGVTFIWYKYPPAVALVYGPLSRPVWACCTALLVFCCIFGRVPLLKGFLSWYPWVPLSRLTYGVYLIHTVLITRNVFSARNPRHYDNLAMINSLAGTIFWSCIGSLLLWLIAEAPVNNLLQLYLKSKMKTTPIADPHGIPNATPSTTASSSGNLQENLPSVTAQSYKLKVVGSLQTETTRSTRMKTTPIADPHGIPNATPSTTASSSGNLQENLPSVISFSKM